MIYASPHTNEPIYARQRGSRRATQDAEFLLWQELRTHQFRYKFRRRYTIDVYRVDFCCRKLKLVIELESTKTKYRESYHKEREAFLTKQGFHILRLPDEELQKDKKAVVDIIRKKVFYLERVRSY